MDLDRTADKVSSRQQRMLWVASMFMVSAAFLLLLDPCIMHFTIFDRGVLSPSAPVVVQVPKLPSMMAVLKAFSL